LEGLLPNRKAVEPEDAGHLGASLVQFSEALNHGISAERLGDASPAKSQNTRNIFLT
jgi:hypothetical protein